MENAAEAAKTAASADLLKTAAEADLLTTAAETTLLKTAASADLLKTAAYAALQGDFALFPFFFVEVVCLIDHVLEFVVVHGRSVVVHWFPGCD